MALLNKWIQLLSDIDNAICCCSRPLSILWEKWALPLVRQSILTRYRYMSMLLLVTLIAMLMLSNHTWNWILTDHFCSKLGYKACEVVHGPGPVYRMFFGLALYFGIMSGCLVTVENTKTKRSYAHNHFWTSRSLLLVIFLTGFILLPRTMYAGEVWHFFGLNASFAFIIIQCVLLIDIVHMINFKVTKWMEQEAVSRLWRIIVIWFPTVFFYAVSILGTVAFYRLYANKQECSNNTFFISFNVYMCLAGTLVSVHPIVKAARPRSGLLQSSVVTAYSTYILWMALSGQPDDLCNPSREYVFPGDVFQNEDIVIGLAITFAILIIFSSRIFESPQYGKYQPSPREAARMRRHQTTQCTLEGSLVEEMTRDEPHKAATTVATSDNHNEPGVSNDAKQQQQGSSVRNIDQVIDLTAVAQVQSDRDFIQYRMEQNQVDREAETLRQTAPRLPSIIYDDELRGVQYSYSFFMFLMCLSCLYIMMTITNWYRPEEEENYSVKLIVGWGSVWIKLCAGSFCTFTYIWSLMAPVIFPYSYKDLVFYDFFFGNNYS